MVTIEELKQKYPSPITTDTCFKRFSSLFTTEAYCVGGAVCKTASGVDDRNNSFPTTAMIAEALMILNENLEAGTACVVSRDVIGANDGGDFNKAWNIVDEALKANGEIKQGNIETT